MQSSLTAWIHDEQPEMLRALLETLDSSYTPIVITDAQLELPGPGFVYVNRAFSRLTGYEAHELEGKTPRILQGPETDRGVLDRLRQNLQEGKPFTGSTVNYRKDGSPYYLEWNIAPIFIEGELRYFISFQRDVTADLELVKQQQEVLLNDSRLKELGKMISGISHQWQQPVTALSMLFDDVEDGIETKTVDEAFILESLRRGKEIIHKMVEIHDSFRGFVNHKHDTGGQDTRTGLDELLQLFGRQYEVSGMRIALEMEEGAFAYPGLRGDLQQIILIYLNNTKDACQDLHHCSVRVGVDDLTDRSVLWYEDNAGGVPESLVPSLFETFTSSKGAGNMGLGLSLVKTLAEKAGGGVAYRRLPEGSRFELIFKKRDS